MKPLLSKAVSYHKPGKIAEPAVVAAASIFRSTHVTRQVAQIQTQPLAYRDLNGLDAVALAFTVANL